jgi:hypothetical protein
LSEALAEGFFWNILKFGPRIQFDVLRGYETYPLKVHLQGREEPKSSRARSGVEWLDVGRNAFLYEKLLYNNRYVAQSAIVKQKLLSSPLATRHTISAEVHQATAVKLVCRNDQ